MTGERLLGTSDRMTALSKRLSTSSKVRSYDSTSEPQSWTLAYTFSELEQSFRKFNDDHLPKLLAEQPSPESVDRLLREIGEEFRHILYHIHACEYYSYLSEPDSQHNGS